MSGMAVVVVSYNTRDLLDECLASARAEGASEIVVVDVGSTDGSVEMVRADHRMVTIVETVGNPGYGSAANAGVSRCDAEHVLLLNADTVIRPGAVAVLHRYLNDHDSVGLCGPRLVYPDGRSQHSCFPFPGSVGWLLENDPLLPVAGLIPPLRRRLLHYAPPSTATAVPWVLGAALAFRRRAFESVGGFDPDFFMYFEEVDLCRRLADSGWATHFVPHATVVHVGGASTRQAHPRMMVAHFRSTIRFYRKHHRGVQLQFWLAVMRLKVLARIGQDAFLLLLQPRGRTRRRERLVAWRRALREGR